MGTRGSLIIAIDGVLKETYNHYDSYPEELGENILTELKKIDAGGEDAWKKFKANAKKLKLVGKSKASKTLQEKYTKFYDGHVNGGDKADWYCLLRECQGANYIPNIASGEVAHMVDGSGFHKDSLFCEYAYVIDLDKMEIEFYEGFQNKKQVGNRFGEVAAKTYFPVAKVGSLPLIGISKDKKASEEMMKLYTKFGEENKQTE